VRLAPLLLCSSCITPSLVGCRLLQDWIANTAAADRFGWPLFAK
jgi:hypothetical protein